MQLSHYGKILLHQIEEINRTYSHLQIEHFSIMPNHLHMIVTVYKNGSSGTPTPTNAVISAFVSTLKRFTNQKAGVKLWQRGYYDHILRDEDDYLRAWQYIEENPFGKE
ncbi:MAG: transposase [Candidatus Fimenecus sp.]